MRNEKHLYVIQLITLPYGFPCLRAIKDAILVMRLQWHLHHVPYRLKNKMREWSLLSLNTIKNQENNLILSRFLSFVLRIINFFIVISQHWNRTVSFDKDLPLLNSFSFPPRKKPRKTEGIQSNSQNLCGGRGFTPSSIQIYPLALPSCIIFASLPFLPVTVDESIDIWFFSDTPLPLHTTLYHAIPTNDTHMLHNPRSAIGFPAVNKPFSKPLCHCSFVGVTPRPLNGSFPGVLACRVR